MNKLEHYLQIVKERLLSQENRDTNITHNALRLTVYSGFVLSFAAFIFINSDTISVIIVSLFIGVIALFVAVSLVGIFATRPKKWKTGPQLNEVSNRLENEHGETNLVYDIADAYKNSVEINEKQLRKRTLLLKCIAVFLIAQVLCFASLTLFSAFPIT